MNQGEYLAAYDHLTKALTLHETVGDGAWQTGTLSSLGFACCRLGEFREALDHFQRAELLCRDSDALQESILLINAGTALGRLGRIDEAMASYRQGLELSRAAGVPEAESCVLAHTGDTYRELGRHDEALELLQHALTVAVENQLVPKVVCVLHYLGNVYLETGRTEEGFASLESALRIMRTEAPSDCESETGVLIDYGAGYRATGDLERATDLIDEGLRMARSRAERYQQARALMELAEVRKQTSRPELAEEDLRQAHKLFQQLGLVAPPPLRGLASR
jgi:tetratricopeptide (TPR) repeat protein